MLYSFNHLLITKYIEMENSKRFKRYVDEKTKRCFYVELEKVGNNPLWSVTYVQSSSDEITIILHHVHELQNFHEIMTGELLCLS